MEKNSTGPMAATFMTEAAEPGRADLGGAPPQPPEHILQFFAHAHLPPHLQAVSKPFCELAEQLVANLPRNPERTVALRKLLEAKDAAVRALVGNGKEAPKPSVAQRPSIGRIVHYMDSTYERPLAAMVTAVHEDGTVDLTIFPPQELAMKLGANSYRATHVPHESPTVQATPEKNCWIWPPRS